MTLIATLLVLLSVIGWASFISDDDILTFPESILAIMAAMGGLMMMAFILKIPSYSARFIMYGGWVALLRYLFVLRHTSGLKAVFKQDLPFFLIAIAVMAFICMMAWGLQFGSIDDYSFWGTISRFLFVFDHLPENATIIKASFLQYTPGLACFHYVFYQLAGFYSPMLNYIAQDIIILTPLLLFIDVKQPWRSLATIMIVLIMLYLSYGNILAKLEVDATVAMWFFAMLWVAIRPKQASIWLMLFGLIFLSNIKEIGLLFSLFVAGIHYLTHRKQPGQIKRLMLLLGGVLLIKLAWLYHVNQFGFASFAARITPLNALISLMPGHPEYVNAQILFLKGLLTSPFDHIFKFPFAAVFILSGWQIHRIARLARLQPQHIILLKAFALLLPFYIINIYWLQAIVFRVGYLQPHLLDFPRYFNMAFVPFILSVVVVSLDTKPIHSQEKLKRWATALSLVALVFIVGGKIERTKKFYHPYDFNHLVVSIHNLTAQMDQTKPICLTHLPNLEYQVLMPLQYRLLPRRIMRFNDQSANDCGVILDFAKLKN